MGRVERCERFLQFTRRAWPHFSKPRILELASSVLNDGNLAHFLVVYCEDNADDPPVEYVQSCAYINNELQFPPVSTRTPLSFGGDLDSTGMRKLRTAYRGLRVHVKEAVNYQVLTTTTHWLLN